MDLYSSVKRGTFGVAVGGSLFRNGKLLVLRRVPTKKVAPGMYETPGGSVEFGESLEEAVRREFKEETGMDVVVRHVFHLWHFFVDDGAKQYFCSEFLVSEDNHSEVRLSDEHDDAHWIARNEIDSLPMTEHMREGVRRAFDAAGL